MFCCDLRRFRNVGGWDRAVRLILGAAALAVGLFLSPERPGLGLALKVLGAVGLLTGLVGFCPPYLLFGFSTVQPPDVAPVRSWWRRALRAAGLGVAGLGALAAIGGALAAVEILSRPELAAVASTTHPSLSRQQCLDCHAPIAAEWRESFHFRSLTGTPWKDVRELGYLRTFDRTRKRCVDCHAPANVLDLVEEAAGDGGVESLGVECTPSLLREPRGTIPAARLDAPELGVDCTACHVSRRGIVGPGRGSGRGSGRLGASAHETIADPRFQTTKRTSETLCRTCHRATVEAWKRTSLASEGVSCIECHMPGVTAPSVDGGPERARRSHRFVADKDPELLDRAVNARLTLVGERTARFLLTNDRVGHFFPSGGNWLLVKLEARDTAGRLLAELGTAYGREEALLLDFWPFTSDNRLAFGEQRELLFELPPGPGTVTAEVRYHDWMRMERTVLTLNEKF